MVCFSRNRFLLLPRPVLVNVLEPPPSRYHVPLVLVIVSDDPSPSTVASLLISNLSISVTSVEWLHLPTVLLPTDRLRQVP